MQLDPGIGFGKTLEHNLELLRRLDEIVAIGRPVVLGDLAQVRSSAASPGATSPERVHGTVASCVLALRARRPRVPRPRRRRRRVTRSRWRLLRCRAMAPDDPDPYEDEDDEDLSSDDEEDEGPEVGVTVEIVGLSLYTHHGVTAAEREIGQRLVLDVRFDVGEPDALITDRVEDTVDYGEVCQVIALIAQQRSYKTLERLCAVIADRLASQFGAESVTVKAAKPEPPIPLPVEEVSVEVWREERP